MSDSEFGRAAWRFLRGAVAFATLPLVAMNANAGQQPGYGRQQPQAQLPQDTVNQGFLEAGKLWPTPNLYVPLPQSFPLTPADLTTIDRSIADVVSRPQQGANGQTVAVGLKPLLQYMTDSANTASGLAAGEQATAQHLLGQNLYFKSMVASDVMQMANDFCQNAKMPGIGSHICTVWAPQKGDPAYFGDPASVWSQAAVEKRFSDSRNHLAEVIDTIAGLPARKEWHTGNILANSGGGIGFQTRVGKVTTPSSPAAQLVLAQIRNLEERLTGHPGQQGQPGPITAYGDLVQNLAAQAAAGSQPQPATMPAPPASPPPAQVQGSDLIAQTHQHWMQQPLGDAKAAAESGHLYGKLSPGKLVGHLKSIEGLAQTKPDLLGQNALAADIVMFEASRDLNSIVDAYGGTKTPSVTPATASSPTPGADALLKAAQRAEDVLKVKDTSSTALNMPRDRAQIGIAYLDGKLQSYLHDLAPAVFAAPKPGADPLRSGLSGAPNFGDRPSSTNAQAYTA